jgi:hypothetical protein
MLGEKGFRRLAGIPMEELAALKGGAYGEPTS